MAQNYYYLVTGLPDLVEGGGKGFSYSRIRQEIVEELSSEDLDLLKLLLLQFDNDNVVDLINKKTTFDLRGWFSHEELQEAMADIDILPKYLQIFIENYKSGKESVAGIGLLGQLYQLYFTEISTKNEWFAKWSDFSADLLNVLAAANARELGMSPEKSIIPFNDNAEKIAKSRAADFGLGNSVSWIEHITKNIVDPIALEEAIDGIYWKKVDELAEMKTFGIESVLGFMVKANRIERWLRLDTEKGIIRANDLIEKLKLSVQK